ncbi:MAG: ATP-dependent protease ATPase subunit HslU [Bacteroidota bacterium]
MNKSQTTMTPSQIVQELDRYIIGQKEAKKSLAIALRGRWRRMQSHAGIRDEIVPSNIMIIGPTGSGKTECARRLAKINEAPFIKTEATKYTERGYVGGEVEGMVRALVDKSYTMVKKAKTDLFKAQATQKAEDIILDILIPPVNNAHTEEAKDHKEAKKLNADTRLRFRDQIRKGLVDDREIEIEVVQTPPSGIGFMGHGMIDESTMSNLQNMMQKMLLPAHTKKRKVTIAQAKEILIEQEKNKLIDVEALKEEALKKAELEGIIFIDEIDKIALHNGNSESSRVSQEGVQRDLLPLVEGATVNTKYGTIKTDHILFIAAGAFHQNKPADLMPELQGRFPIRVYLNSLTQQDFFRILKQPQNSLIKQYKALFQAEGVTLHFQEEAIQEIAHQASTINQNIENIGARRLHTVMSHLLQDFLFDMPDRIQSGQTIEVTKALVLKQLAKLAQDKNTSQYIL